MGKAKAREFLLQVETVPASGTFVTLGGLGSASLTINQELIDVTDKASGGFRELLEDGGIRNLSLSGSGFMTDETNFQIMWIAFLAGIHLNYRIVSGIDDQFEGKFMVGPAERGGETSGAETFSATFESDGVIVYTPAP